MKLHDYEPSGPENLQSQTRLDQKIESSIKALGVLHGRLINVRIRPQLKILDAWIAVQPQRFSTSAGSRSALDEVGIAGVG